MIEKIKNGKFDFAISNITNDVENYRNRLLSLIKNHDISGEFRIFSAPGRSEIGGNHTDHQRGKVLACSVNLDILAIVRLNNSNKIMISSDGYKPFYCDISETLPLKEEENTTESIVRGIFSKFIEMGYKISGFDVFATSNVLKGSGLSSSAAFETLIGTIINNMFCNEKESAIKIAEIGQYAENIYFGKPSGLMDQMASSVGSFVHIDFYDSPIVTNVNAKFDDYNLCIVDTGGNHADLTSDYAEITQDLALISNFFGEKYLSRVSEKDFYDNIPKIREKICDRAIIRAIHFFDENKIADLEVEALESGNIYEFLRLVMMSGFSSFMHLQNAYSIKSPENQGVPLVLALCKKILDGAGAYRLHGGGFGGTIQAFVPKNITKNFKTQIEKVVGINKCYILDVRKIGGTEIKEI